jgi:hypothetical protein
MEAYRYCQSCARRMDEGALGTEINGSKNLVYCNHCYQNGAFTRPDLTLEEMSEIVRADMRSRNTPEATIDRVVARLPGLARWLCSRARPVKKADYCAVLAE